MIFDQIESDVASMVDEKGDKPFIIGICGGSCSGKTSYVLPEVMSRINGTISLISQDHFQWGLDGMQFPHLHHGWENPLHFGIDVLPDLLQKLQQHQPVSIPVYSFREGKRCGEQTILPADIIIIEGLYAGHEALLPYIDYLIYVDAPFTSRFIRRLLRNSYERYIRDPQDVILGLLSSSVYAAHDEWNEKQRHHAHAIVSNPLYFSDVVARYSLKELEYHPFPVKKVLGSYPLDEETEIRLVINVMEQPYFLLYYRQKLMLQLWINHDHLITLQRYLWVELNPYNRGLTYS
jgi:uridine kinase